MLNVINTWQPLSIVWSALSITAIINTNFLLQESLPARGREDRQFPVVTHPGSCSWHLWCRRGSSEALGSVGKRTGLDARTRGSLEDHHGVEDPLHLTGAAFPSWKPSWVGGDLNFGGWRRFPWVWLWWGGLPWHRSPVLLTNPNHPTWNSRAFLPLRGSLWTEIRGRTREALFFGRAP